MAKVKGDVKTKIIGCKYMGICTRCGFKFYFNMSQNDLNRSVLMCPLCKIGDVQVYGNEK